MDNAPDTLPKRTHRRHLAREMARRRWGRALAVAIGIVVGLGSFMLFARNTYEVGPAQVTATASLWPTGETRVELPPFGAVDANTHAAPIAVSLRLTDVDVDGLRRLAQEGIPRGAEVRNLREQLVNGAREAAARGLAGAVAVAAFVAWALSRSGRHAAVTAMVTAAVLGGIMGWALYGFDESAFREPHFRGTLAFAPGLIEIVQRRAQDVRQLEEEITGIATDLANYYASPQTFASGGDLPNTFRVLHVTDIHLDPIGLRLSRELARSFDVGFIIDTGDINNFGTLAEGLVVVRGLDTSERRVFVGGNHDSPDIIEAMRGVPRVTVLHSEVATVGGLRIFGVTDPVGRGLVADATPDPVMAARVADLAASSLRTRLSSGEATPDIVAVHQPAMVPPFVGLAPVVLFGHTHTPVIEERDGTWAVNSGTTGGVSFRGLEPDPHIPHTASILYYTLETPRRLVAVDTVEVFGRVSQTSLTRTVIDESLLPEASGEATGAGGAGEPTGSAAPTRSP